MTVVNSRESMLSHESKEYIESRPKWTFGRIPDLSDYRKLSVDSMKEAFKLARLGQETVSAFFPSYRGAPLYLSFTQSLIVGAAIISREQAEKAGLDYDKYRSILLICNTRWGKSFVNGIIAIILAGGQGKEVRIGGATKDKAGLIQEKVVSLLPSAAKSIQDGLIVTEEDGDINKKVARLATQTSKEALAWRNGGSIKLFSTNENRKNVEVAAAGAIGVGGDTVLLDEVQLMTPVGFHTASRFMMENPDTKRICVGNPQIAGHFKDLYDDPDTFVVHINDIGAIVEERMSRKGMDLTGIPSYSPEYRAFIMCEFPSTTSGDRFFTSLPLPPDKVNLPTPERSYWFIGIDSAYKGGDALMVTLISFNEAGDKKWVMVESQVDLKKKYPEWKDDTTTNIALDILKIMDDHDIQNACLDIGFGIHLYEAITRIAPDAQIEPVNFSHAPTDWRVETNLNAKIASNKRAEMYLDVRDLCEGKSLYINTDNYDEIIRQMREIGGDSKTASGKIRIEPKAEIKKRLGRSPDNLDSLCLAVRAMVTSGMLEDGLEEEEGYVEFF